jgi:hypothetical protein
MKNRSLKRAIGRRERGLKKGFGGREREPERRRGGEGGRERERDCLGNVYGVSAWEREKKNREKVERAPLD